MLAPLTVSGLEGGGWRSALAGFAAPSAALALAGWGMLKRFRPAGPVVLSVAEASVVVVASWSVVCLASAWPFAVMEELGFTLALFESVSGWTTTGLSVVDVGRASPSILLWRSVMQLAGGAGLAIVMAASIAGPLGPGLSIAEGRGEQLVPQVRRSARMVLILYTAYALGGVLALRMVGMTALDAVSHAFAAVSTGGFSTRAESVGYWNSAAVEGVSMVLMTLGSLNFLTAYLLLQGRLRAAGRDGEVRLAALLAAVGSLVLWALVCGEVFPETGKRVRTAVFETLSALTTTGFSTTTYDSWNDSGFLTLTLLMIVGGGACSTAGGLKQYRVHLLFRTLLWEIRRPFLPRTAVQARYLWKGEEKDFIDDARIRQTAAFVFLYLTAYVAGTGILVAYGYGLRESLFEFASALSTVGLSAGVTHPSAPAGVLWTEMAGMFLGRLEFFVVFTGLGKALLGIMQVGPR